MNKIIFGNHALPTLVALSQKEQERGLMWLSKPSVMSFPYETAEVRKFWMHNTFFPLDIVSCHNGKIINIVRGIPFSTAHIGASEPVDLVVELPVGLINSIGIKVGQSVRLAYSILTLAQKLEMRAKSA